MVHYHSLCIFCFFQMIQMQTVLLAADNSGARYVQCIKALGGYNRTYSYCGDIIKVSIKKLKLIRKVKKGELYFGLIARTIKNSVSKDGSHSKFNQNAVILLNIKKKAIGTRIFGAQSRFLRQKRFTRILVMSGNKVY